MRGFCGARWALALAASGWLGLAGCVDLAALRRATTCTTDDAGQCIAQPEPATGSVDDAGADAELDAELDAETASADASDLCRPDPCAGRAAGRCDPASGKCECVHGCGVEGQTRCVGGGVSACVADEHGCRQWQFMVQCSSGACSSDEMSCEGCQNSCTGSGDVQCQDGKRRSCVAGADGCLTWSEPRACDDGVACTRDGCDAQGEECSFVPDTSACQEHAARCEQGMISTCVADAVGCLSFKTSLACASGSCGDMVSCLGCNNSCPSAGLRECKDGMERQCLANANGCLAWSSPASCDDKLPCTRDACDAAGQRCVHTPDDSVCGPEGTVKCSAGEVARCQASTPGCPRWEPQNTCATGQCASNGISCMDCRDSCPQVGASTCSGGKERTCVADAQGCLAWGAATSCDDGIACTDDACDSAGRSCIHTTRDALCSGGDVCNVRRCDARTGCINTQPQIGCSDGDACTSNDKCSAGQCLGTADLTDTDQDGTRDCVDPCPRDECAKLGTSCKNGSREVCSAGSNGCKVASFSSCASGSCWDDQRCAQLEIKEWAANVTRAFAVSVGIGTDGAIWVGGAYDGPALTGQAPVGFRDGFVSKWSAGGQLLGTRILSTDNHDMASDIAVAPNGDVVVCGQAGGTLTGGSSANGGGFVMLLAGDAAVNASPRWIKDAADPTFGGLATSCTFASDGSVIVGGRGGGGGMLAAFQRADGKLLWRRENSTTPLTIGLGVATAGSNIYVIGHHDDNDPAKRRAFLSRHGSDGLPLWEQVFETPSEAGAVLGLGADALVTVAVGDNFTGTTTYVMRYSATKVRAYRHDTSNAGRESLLLPSDGLVFAGGWAGAARWDVDASGIRVRRSFPTSGWNDWAVSAANDLIVAAGTINDGPRLLLIRPQP